jgi:hypothetical protein
MEAHAMRMILTKSVYLYYVFRLLIIDIVMYILFEPRLLSERETPVFDRSA